MIKMHEFNTEWYGERVGLVTDMAFFHLERKKQKELLAPFSWVEFKSELEPGLPFAAITEAGFYQSDTQFPLKIALEPIEILPGMEKLSVNFGHEKPFRIFAKEMRVFSRERFMTLSGMTPEKINRRYALWSNNMIEKQPEAAVRIIKDGKVQGWFISEIEGDNVNFTLAMLAANGDISGRELYRMALWAYKKRGLKTGTSAFSSMNPAVMNIFSALGAKFLPALGCWFYQEV